MRAVAILVAVVPLALAAALAVDAYFRHLAEERKKIEATDMPEPYRSDKNV